MADRNFIVHNGLTVGPLTIDATTGDIAGVGNLSLAGDLGVGQIEKNDSSVTINDTGSGSTINFTIDGTSGPFMAANGFTTGGNVTCLGGYFVGNGSQLQGLPAGYTDSDVASYLPTYTGIVGASNVYVSGDVTAVNFIGDGSQLSGIDSTAINDGTSNVRVVTSGGNVSIGVDGAVSAEFATDLVEFKDVAYFTDTTQSSTFGVGAVVISGGASIGANLHVAEDLHVAGNLEVNGTQTIFNTNNATFNDGLIYLADGNSGDVLDLGFAVAFTAGAGYQHGGLVRDASDSVYKLFEGVTDEPTTTINFTQASYANLRVAGLQIASLNIGGTAITTSAAELNFVDGVTSAIQTQLNAKAPLASPSFTTKITTPVIEKSGTNGVGDIGQTGNRFATIYGLATSAQYADLAEKYVADADYEPGTVLHFGGEHEVALCDVDHCTRVAGVVSTDPAYRMNDALEAEHVAMVALTGRVPCKVQGPVAKGDMMVSAGNGKARAEANPKVGAVIGKALENFDGEEGVIEVVIGKH